MSHHHSYTPTPPTAHNRARTAVNGARECAIDFLLVLSQTQHTKTHTRPSSLEMLWLLFTLLGFTLGDVIPTCDFPFEERRDAYEDSWDIGECESRGYCWAEGPPGVPWCYFPIDLEGFATSAECQAALASGNRRECAVGDEEITGPICANKGCCWAAGNKEEDPWCFHPAGADFDDREI